MHEKFEKLVAEHAPKMAAAAYQGDRLEGQALVEFVNAMRAAFALGFGEGREEERQRSGFAVVGGGIEVTDCRVS